MINWNVIDEHKISCCRLEETESCSWLLARNKGWESQLTATLCAYLNISERKNLNQLTKVGRKWLRNIMILAKLIDGHTNVMVLNVLKNLFKWHQMRLSDNRTTLKSRPNVKNRMRKTYGFSESRVWHLMKLVVKFVLSAINCKWSPISIVVKRTRNRRSWKIPDLDSRVMVKTLSCTPWRSEPRHLSDQ